MAVQKITIKTRFFTDIFGHLIIEIKKVSGVSGVIGLAYVSLLQVGGVPTTDLITPSTPFFYKPN